jgi:hypothetical protein
VVSIFQTYNFSIVLVVESGVVNGMSWDRLPKTLKQIPDPDLANTNEDPIKFLSLHNIVSSPAMTPYKKPW